METVILVFMAFVSVITLLIVLIVAKDIIHSALKKDKKEKKETLVQKAEEHDEKEEKPVEVEVSDEKVEERVEENVEEKAQDDNSITFSAGSNETHTDKYLALNSEEKSYYDEVARYAQQIEGAKRNLNERYEDYKVGNTRLVRLRIKRGVIMAELVLPNSDFKNYVSDNKIAVKLAPTVFKVVSWEVVKVVKDSLDIVVKAISDEKERKKEIAREKRRARRSANKAQNNAK